MSKKKILKVAVIGVGNMGRHHVRNYSEMSEVDLVSIADLDEIQGKDLAKKFQTKWYKNYIEMLDSEELDAVTIAVPSIYHHSVGLEVINRGINILIEKPIAMNEKESLDLINAAKRKKVKLMVGHIERFNPAVIALKNVIDSGRLGKIISVVTRRVGVMPPQIKDANVLIDLAVHDIDIVSYLLGVYPDRVSANGGRAFLDNREDYAEVFLNYGHVTGVVQVNWVTPVRIRSLFITGTEGYAEIDYLTQKLVIYKSSYKKDVDDFGEFLIRFSEPEKEDVIVDKKEPLRAEIESFLSSITQGTPIKTTGEHGLKALKIALSASDDISRHFK